MLKMSLLQQRRFLFTWQIMNFSMCPQKHKENFLSPVFVVEILGNPECQMMIYPKGNVEKNFISCYLSFTSFESATKTIQIDGEITIYSSNVKARVSKKITNSIYKKDEFRGYNEMISTTDLYGDKEAYLPNDTLTIKCWMWPTDNSDGAQKVDSSSALGNQETSFIAPNSERRDECSVVTRVEVQSKTVSWPIKNFSSIEFDEKLTIRVPSSIKDAPSFQITLWKSAANQSAEIEIRRQKTDSSKQTLVKCKASVFQTPKDIKYGAEDEHLFDSDDNPWKFPSFVKLDKLEEDNYFNKTCDVLHLRFEFSYSRLGGMHHVEKTSFRQYGTFVNFNEPIDEFRRLYKDGEVHDVAIRVGDRDFKVLKNILKARSPVFDAMFDSDMKEKETGVVDISDVDADTMDKMLTFIYSNALEDLQSEDAIKLYSAADKYQILSLKFRCTWILATRICVSNVCGILVLADRHGDEFLRDCAESFVRANSTEVFNSEEWLNLIQNSGTVAANVMLKMLTN